MTSPQPPLVGSQTSVCARGCAWRNWARKPKPGWSVVGSAVAGHALHADRLQQDSQEPVTDTPMA